MVDNVREIIDRGLCDRFETAWLEGKHPQLDEYVMGGDVSPATLEEMIRLDMGYAWRERWTTSSDETPLAPPRVEDYLQRFPSVNEADRVIRLIRQEYQVSRASCEGVSYAKRFPELADHPSAGALFSQETASFSETKAENRRRITLPESGEFGSYILLGKIGEGGMGVVYRAQQKGADRIVALKVIRGHQSRKKKSRKRTAAIERFRTEAKVAASLEHENIVPVYDVGEIDEQLYFAMRYVEGDSLREKVESQLIENKQAAAYLLGAANGIAEAHRQGILHRDLKPHNIMVDARNDRAMVADFGLAKVIEDDSEMTREGEVLGTPSYMPPEQINNSSSATELSDVYSLGATLYHTITGRPPFQAAHSLSTMRMVIFQEPVEPRKLNTEIDADLNTICLKCLQKEPEKRYASAADLAADLNRYLNGYPIEARPISRVERTARWCRRNPLLAALSGLAMMLAVSVFAAVTIGYRNTNAALEKAEEHFALARETVDELYTEASEIDLTNAPGMQPLKRKLLTRALAYYERMIIERENDDELTSELALNHFRVGSITSEIDSASHAERHFKKAIKIQQALLDDDPRNEQTLVSLADSWNALGRVQAQLGNIEGAKTSFQKSEGLRQELVTGYPENSEYQRKLANIQMNRGLLANRLGNIEQAEGLFEKAQSLRSTLLEKEELSERENVIRDFAKGAFNSGTLAADQQRYSQAIALLEDALSKFAMLVQSDPENLSDQLQLAISHYYLGDILQLLDERMRATSHFEEAESRLRQLTEENPKVDEFHEHLVNVLLGQAQFEIYLGQSTAAESASDSEKLQQSADHYSKAEERLRYAIAELKRLRERYPEHAFHHFDLAVALHLLGDVQLAFHENGDTHGPTVARKTFQQALDAMEPLQKQFDSVPAYQVEWTSIHQSLEELDED